MEEYQFTFQLTEEDYLRGVRFKAKPEGGFQLTFSLASIMIMLFLIGIYLFIRSLMSWQTLIPVVLIPVFYLIGRYFWVPRYVNRIYQQQKELQKPVEIQITMDALHSANEFGQSTRPWSNFTNWKENEHLFLLYHSDALQTLIPKRIFSNQEQIEFLRERLRENIKTKVETKARKKPLLLIILIIVLVFVIMLRRYAP